MKEATSYRISGIGKQIIKILSNSLGLSEASVVELSIRKLAKEEGVLMDTTMDLREVVFSTGLTHQNRCELIPDELVQKFLNACSPEARTHWEQRPYEDQQLHAGWEEYHQYGLKEAKRLGYKPSEWSLVGRDHWVILESTTGIQEGRRIASKYGFDPDEAERHGYDVKWGVIEWRRDGDAVIFIGANEKYPEPDYHVGLVWYPADLQAKYQSGHTREIPYILI